MQDYRSIATHSLLYLVEMATFTAFESIPPALLDQLPSAEPPPGITPNFTNPLSIGPIVNDIAIVFMTLCLLSFAARCYNKLIIARQLSWDDSEYSLSWSFKFNLYLVTCTLGLVGLSSPSPRISLI